MAETTSKADQAEPTNPLEPVAQVAHHWYGRIAELAREAQADIEKYVPKGVVDAVENTAKSDIEGAVKETL